MIAKLIVHDRDRDHARARMLRALDEFVIEGPPTLIGFHKALLSHPCFAAGETCHGIVESQEIVEQAESLSHGTTRLAPAPDGTSGRPRSREVEVDGRRFTVTVVEPEPPWAALARHRRERAGSHAVGPGEAVTSPMQGTVLAVRVAEGDTVEAGQLLCIVEAMKMENEIHAHHAGTVTHLSVEPGQPVTSGQVICIVEG
jgi:acetyl-CoA/propionyl-CoA carboxylase biotin carboxyl carrier protein